MAVIPHSFSGVDGRYKYPCLIVPSLPVEHCERSSLLFSADFVPLNFVPLGDQFLYEKPSQQCVSIFLRECKNGRESSCWTPVGDELEAYRPFGKSSSCLAR